MSLAEEVDGRLKKIRWQQELARQGYERNRMSPELAEALRNEIRTALDAGGKPFDVTVARRVYDLAIAARDMCIAASGSVKEAIDQIEDTNGPMETFDAPGTPESAAQVSESFGARIMRELLALLPADFRKTHEDPHVLIAAIADARERGMHDLAAKLEQRLVGTPLEQPKITRTEVVADSYEHGFIDGSMQANFERGTVDGHASVDQQHRSSAYREGFEAGRARRTTLLASGPVEAVVVDVGSFEHGFADGKSNVPPESADPDYKEGYLRGTEARYLGNAQGEQAALPGGQHVDRKYPDPRIVDPPLCAACKVDPDPRGASVCHDCREIARANRAAGCAGNGPTAYGAAP